MLKTRKPFYIPVENLTTPRSGNCIVNRWWVVHPDKGIVFYGDGHIPNSSPQCNPDKRITRQIQKRSYPDCDIQFINVAYIGHQR